MDCRHLRRYLQIMGVRRWRKQCEVRAEWKKSTEKAKTHSGLLRQKKKKRKRKKEEKEKKSRRRRRRRRRTKEEGGGRRGEEGEEEEGDFYELLFRKSVLKFTNLFHSCLRSDSSIGQFTWVSSLNY
jgi:hypothetical protein